MGEHQGNVPGGGRVARRGGKSGEEAGPGGGAAGGWISSRRTH